MPKPSLPKLVSDELPLLSIQLPTATWSLVTFRTFTATGSLAVTNIPAPLSTVLMGWLDTPAGLPVNLNAVGFPWLTVVVTIGVPSLLVTLTFTIPANSVDNTIS